MTKKARVTKEVIDWINHHIENDIEFALYKEVPHLTENIFSYNNKIAWQVVREHCELGIIDIRPATDTLCKLVIRFTQVTLNKKINNIINEES